MITHKDKLQNQIKKLQSLINDISESELEEKLSIRGGVIVDLTCDSINTYSINTNSNSTSRCLHPDEYGMEYELVNESIIASNDLICRNWRIAF